jgi:Ulp1 family protease
LEHHSTLQKGKNDKKRKTYNSWDSLVVTHPTTNQPACGLSMAERTGSPVFHTLWSYVIDEWKRRVYMTQNMQEV